MAEMGRTTDRSCELTQPCSERLLCTAVQLHAFFCKNVNGVDCDMPKRASDQMASSVVPRRSRT
jgi:hypothetical protein